jgi:hypothetical protein
MKIKKPHSITTLREIYDYIFRRNANGSRHRLERKMQQEPFLDDAVEGFTFVGEERARKDIEALNSKINQKKGKTPVYWYTGIAASLLLLIIAGVTYLLMENSGRWQKQQQLAHEQKKTESVQESITDEEFYVEPLSTEQEESTADSDPSLVLPFSPSEESPDHLILADVDHSVSPEKPDLPQPLPIITPDMDEWQDEEINLAEHIYETLPIVIVQEERINAERTVSGAVSQVRETPGHLLPWPFEERRYRIIRAQVVDGMDQSALPGATVSISGTTHGTITDMSGFFELKVPEGDDIKLVISFIGFNTMEVAAADVSPEKTLTLNADLASLDEIVVVGYGIQENRQGHEQSLHRGDRFNRRDYSPPLPVDGYSHLNRFLRDNAILPDTAQQTRVVVVLRFEISHDGTPNNFEVLRSPTNIYSQMAIDLINRGPAWQPASLAGSFVRETVRVRVVFRKEQ